MIEIMDEDDYFEDYAYLIGTPAELKIDQIEVEFKNNFKCKFSRRTPPNPFFFLFLTSM
ncbi:hypothetical protein BATR1942_17690 [Bacillus atrophaeus 1942]|uniref:Uncharacterized protein n=1 Tax=Bacillus atrophaeus (strain 1942) TaxID=720555 RepID=A0ABN3ZEF8_BACA1|nr:hypothetical protein BATR1942_17690 [Bacillus atrophaeus 1942]